MTTWLPILEGKGGVDVSDGLEGHIFVSRGAGSDKGPPPDVWQMLDLRTIGIPPEAKCVDVSGLLIITMGDQDGFFNVCVAFKRPSDNLSTIRGNYVLQALGNASGPLAEGVRTNCASIVTPEDGMIQWGWFYSGQEPGWPGRAAVALNLTFNRWFL